MTPGPSGTHLPSTGEHHPAPASDTPSGTDVQEPTSAPPNAAGSLADAYQPLPTPSALDHASNYSPRTDSSTLLSQVLFLFDVVKLRSRQEITFTGLNLVSVGWCSSIRRGTPEG